MRAINRVGPWNPAEHVVGDGIGHLRDIASHVWTARQ